MKPLDYLLIGHVTKDLTPSGSQLGGAASFAGRVAAALGASVGIVTSAHPAFDLTQLAQTAAIHRINAPETTTFENVYTPNGRIQTLSGRANPIHANDVPRAWRTASIVHLAPVADEIDHDVIDLFLGKAIVGLTPQGWLRGWDENGRIFPKPWQWAEQYFPKVTAVILSEEDITGQTLIQYRQWAKLLILTKGAAGCIVFTETESIHVPTLPVREVEPTGAGDIFAAAFLMAYQQNGQNPVKAAQFANEIAAQSVTQTGLHAKIQHIKHYLAQKSKQYAKPINN
jgi:sugar/nucleoside kinase (ribokinase family)